MNACLEWLYVVLVIPLLLVKGRLPASGESVWAPERLSLATHAAQMPSVCLAFAARTTSALVPVTQIAEASKVSPSVSLSMTTMEMKTLQVAVSQRLNVGSTK